MVSFTQPGSYVFKLSASDSVLTTSANVTITVKLPGPKRAAAAVNAFADATVAFNQSDAILQAVQVAPALPPTAPSGPPLHTVEEG